MNNEAAFRITPRLIIGFGILALGMLWTLDNLDILVVIGLAQLPDRRSNKIGPIVLIAIGSLLLLDKAHLIDFDLGDLIPLGIAALGAKLVWEALSRRRTRSPEAIGDSESFIHAFAMMAGLKRQSISEEFRGADANAIMGGVELDLRNAQIRPGDDVVIDAFAMWGGVEIKVPANWRIVGSVLPIMGAFEDNTHPTGDPGPTLTVRGTAIMGGINVKN
jgi:predicted membrane protein